MRITVTLQHTATKQRLAFSPYRHADLQTTGKEVKQRGLSLYFCVLDPDLPLPLLALLGVLPQTKKKKQTTLYVIRQKLTIPGIVHVNNRRYQGTSMYLEMSYPWGFLPLYEVPGTRYAIGRMETDTGRAPPSRVTHSSRRFTRVVVRPESGVYDKRNEGNFDKKKHAPTIAVNVDEHEQVIILTCRRAEGPVEQAPQARHLTLAGRNVQSQMQARCSSCVAKTQKS